MSKKAGHTAPRAAAHPAVPQTAPDLDKRMLERMLLFSDAVFAIVLTLLVLDLRLPEMPGEGAFTLGGLLSAMAGNFVAFINSFALVGLWWFVHMRITRPVLTFDWPMAMLNFLFLLTVTLVPFASTALTAHGDTDAAWELYWSVNLGSSVTLTLISLAVTRGGGRLIGGITPKQRLITALRVLSPGLCFAGGIIAAALGHHDLARWAWVPIPLLMQIMNWVQRRNPAH